MKRFKKQLLNSKLSNEIYRKLLNIWDFEDWALGVLDDLRSDDERLQILDMINSGETNRNNISMKALEFRGLVGTPIEEFDGNPEDIINCDEE